MEGNLPSSEHSKPILDDTNVVRVVRDRPPAHCIVKVDSFSLLQQEDQFELTEFIVGDYSWVLSVYPNGNKDENGDGHLSLYVTRTGKFNFGTPVSALLRFFVYDQIRENYLIVSDLMEKCFHAMKIRGGISKVLPLGTFNDASNGFLVKDCCIFGAELLLINGNLKASMMSFVRPICDWKYTWRVENWSKNKVDVRYSPTFTFQGWWWKLSLYRRGTSSSAVQAKSVSLFLCLENDLSLTNGSKLFAKYTLCMKNQLKGAHNKDKKEIVSNWFVSRGGVFDIGCGNPDFIPLSDLHDPLKGYLVDDTVIIEVSIEVMVKQIDMEKEKWF